MHAFSSRKTPAPHLGLGHFGELQKHGKHVHATPFAFATGETHRHAGTTQPTQNDLSCMCSAHERLQEEPSSLQPLGWVCILESARSTENTLRQRHLLESMHPRPTDAKRIRAPVVFVGMGTFYRSRSTHRVGRRIRISCGHDRQKDIAQIRNIESPNALQEQ